MNTEYEIEEEEEFEFTVQDVAIARYLRALTNAGVQAIWDGCQFVITGKDGTTFLATYDHDREEFYLKVHLSPEQFLELISIAVEI